MDAALPNGVMMRQAYDAEAREEREGIMREVITIIGVDLAKNVFQLHGHHGRRYHQSRRPRRNYTNLMKTMAYAPESVGFQDLSLRQNSLANSTAGEIRQRFSYCRREISWGRPNPRDWRRADFRSLNGFRLFPTEPRANWFGLIKFPVFSGLPFSPNRTFCARFFGRQGVQRTRGGSCRA